MDTATRSSFVQQLSRWAAKYISSGNSPFRKAQISPSIITSNGEQTPDLVFWINRDSFVAGGFVMCADDSTTLSNAQACANALGVSYFATWSSDKIIFWQAKELSVCHEFSAPKITPDQGTNPFEDALIQLMDQFRTLAVLGTSPPQKLSYWHLANLCLAAAAKAQTSLHNYLRSQPGTKHSSRLRHGGSALLAQQKVHICIARILTLIYLDQLPHNLQPENLDHSLQYLIGNITAGQFPSLAPYPDEPELNETSAIFLHHLLHRLGQVAVFHDSKRACKLLQLLLIHSAPGTIDTARVQTLPVDISLYSNIVRSGSSDNTFIEIDQPARLALKQLIGKLLGWKGADRHSTTIFATKESVQLTLTRGTLYNDERPDTTHRNNYLTNIRLVWQGTGVILPRSTPTWAYEFAYLLGVIAANSTIDLTVPKGLLVSSYSSVLIKMLQDNFTIHTIDDCTTTVRISAIKTTEPMAATLFKSQLQRSIGWQTLKTAEPEMFALALNLPEQIYQLLAQKRLTFAPADQHHENYRSGSELYLASSLGRLFQHHLTPKGGKRKTGGWQPRIPIPGPAILESLTRLGNNLDTPSGHIDELLERHLNIELRSIAPTDLQTSAGAASETPEKTAYKQLTAQIVESVKLNGVRLFPVHYLYDFYRPQLVDYQNNGGHWQITAEFMGTFELGNNSISGAAGTITVADEFLAHAIVLASYCDNKIQLPADNAIVAAIVTRYLNDLAALHDTIWRQAHTAIAQNEPANRLVNRVWKNLALPPWKLVHSFLKRFRIA